MTRFAALLVLLVCSSALGQTKEAFDYWRYSRDIIQHGQQAIFMCNGLFTSNRTLEQVFDQELAYLEHPVGTPEGGDYVVDWNKKTVAIGGETHLGFHCVPFRGQRGNFSGHPIKQITAG